MQPFIERLNQPEILLLDGATGTELTLRGINTTLPMWSATALITDPHIVRQIHIDYVNAGADIITTNTFRTQTRSIGDADRARYLTHLAVRLAREAADHAEHPVYVAGSVATLQDCYRPDLAPDALTCRREQGENVTNLVEAGVDLLLIETMNTIRESEAAARAASIHRVPFIVSFVLNENYDLLSGETLAEAVRVITPLKPAAFMINCIPTVHMSTALKRLSAVTSLPIGGYGNMGTPDDVVGWAAADDMPPHLYCEHAENWLALGAKIIGSCCGSSPDHVAAMRTMLEAAPFANYPV